MGFWPFTVGIVPLSGVFTWVYNHTSRSILAIILLHWWVNLVAETIAVAATISYVHWVPFVVLITAIWGSMTLTNAEEVPRPPLPADRSVRRGRVHHLPHIDR